MDMWSTEVTAVLPSSHSKVLHKCKLENLVLQQCSISMHLAPYHMCACSDSVRHSLLDTSLFVLDGQA